MRHLYLLALLCIGIPAWAQADQTTDKPYVRLVLFTPSDVPVPKGVRERMTQMADTTDAFFFREMHRWGYPPAVKSIFRRQQDGLVEVFNVRGELPVASGKYAKPDYSHYVIDRAVREYGAPPKGVVWWIWVYLGDRPARFNDFAAMGNPPQGGWAMVNYETIPGDYRPDLGPFEGFNGQVFLKGCIHELGHAFGLPHVGPQLALNLGNTLMGPTNMVYGSRNLPLPEKAYLAESSAAILWRHPIFTGSAADKMKMPAVQLSEYTPVFHPDGDFVTISARLQSDQRAHTAILIDDRGGKDEYWFPSYAGRIAPDGTFRFKIDKPARIAGRYRIMFCFDNGLVTGDGVDVMFSEQGDIRKSYSFVNGDFQFVAPPIPAGVKFAAAFRDDFKGSLQPGWRWVDPKRDSSKSLDARDGFLRIAVKGYHDLWPGRRDYTAPRLVREVDGDFTMETKVAGPGRWCGGLLVWKDEGNYIRLDRGIRFRSELALTGAIDGDYTTVAREFVDADPLWLRIERAGSLYRAYYSLDGKQWLPLKRTNTGEKKAPPNAPEDAMSLLKEADFGFREASNSMEMRAPGPLMVGISGMVPGIPLPAGISQSVTDYDYFAITGK